VATIVVLLVMLKPITVVVSLISPRTNPTPGATQAMVRVFDVEPIG